MSSTTSFLHKTTVHRRLAAGNRAHIFFHFLLILSIFYYRFSSYIDNFSTHAWTCMIIAEVILALAWFFSQSFRWRPLTRNVFPENLSGDIDFPGLDVFVCTADPIKEPTLDVMNTVISAMSLDYPAEKLAVYLSDDGGAAVTLQGMREAAAFARWWVPFCKKHDVKTRAPGAYFSGLSDGDEGEHGGEFRDEVKEIKSKYEIFKKRVEGAGDVAHVDDINSISGNGRAPVVQVINDNRGSTDENDIKMPLLVYVSRERRPSYPHRFKAGALNALLRVSGILSNGPYIMVLDCDMFCNDPASAKQAMCLHLDPKMSSELSFVQFPQMFYNVTKNDIYDGQTRSAFKTKWQGMDGLMGPVLTGSGYYLKKKALYGSPDQEDAHLHQPDASSFGHSNLFIASISGATDKIDASTEELLREAYLLASCSFEKGTKWDSEIGYSYECLLESTFTGYFLQCKGWTSMYLYPEKPAFLGCAAIDMKDGLIQLRKWNGSLLELGFSKFSPLSYAISSRMTFLHSMCYAYFSFQPLLAFSFLIYGLVPQFCFAKGIPVFPKANETWFKVFLALWISSHLQHMYEVFTSGGTLRTWWNEQRIWVIKVVSGSLFGCIDCLMKMLGISTTVFRLTNKAIAKEKVENYEKGKFDFEGAQVFMVPMVALVIWNLVCFIGGIWSIIGKGNVSDMFGQLLLSTFLVVVSYPVIEGIVTKKSRGKSE
ncbi:cellulose synthase-like protein G2 isoform X2 [Apium graveolens]|uniref:cellulose synthase-like protein G2 isoform X2 n=1 Tax=Apium graveolens TaxID=4045 RepID=UPI003D7AEA41